MPQNAQYIFALQDKDHNFWKQRADYSIDIDSQPYLLDFSPTGWNDIAFSNVVNKAYKSIDRTVTIPLAYIKDGARILKHILYTRGNNEKTYLIIASQRLDYEPGVSYGYWHKLIFRGEIDWSTFDHFGATVTLTNLEDGLPKYLKANDKTIYEFPMNDPNAIMVKMDGINLKSIKWFSTINEQFIIDVTGFSHSKTRYFPITYLHVQVDGDNVSLNGKSVTPSEFVSIDYSASDQWYLEAIADTEINLQINNLEINYTAIINSADTSHAELKIIKSTGAIVDTLYSKYVSSAFIDDPVIINRNLNISMVAGEKLFLILELNVAKPALASYTSVAKFGVKENKNIYSYKNRYKTTYVRCFRLQYLFSLLTSKVTDSNYAAAISAYLESNKTKVITCGDAIRGLDDAKLKISFDIFFRFLNSIDSVGLIEEELKLNIAHNDDLFEFSDPIVLPEPAANSFKVTIDKDSLISGINIGFPDIKTDTGVLNGKEEWNAGTFRSTEATNINTVLDKISPVKCSCYEIEGIRIAKTGKDTTDSKNDNDVYAIHIEDNLQPASPTVPEHYQIDRSLNAFVTRGLIEAETVFNIIFSPMRSFIRNSGEVHGRFYKSDYINFYLRSGDRNTELVCDGIEEKAAYNIGSMNLPVTVPVLFNMSVSIDEDVISNLLLNPRRGFVFPFNGDDYFATLVSIKSAPSTNANQSIVLRSKATNNLLNLIDWDG